MATILEELDIGGGPLGIFPPVSVRFERPPLILVVSPRDKIEIKTGAQLRPDLELDTIERLEADVDRLGVSSLVVTIGGISTYPAMIMQTGYRDWAVQTVAHEWLHDYLFLRPLGWSYGQSHEIIAINETVADIASQEVGDRALERYYGVPIPDRTPADEDEAAAGGRGARVQFQPRDARHPPGSRCPVGSGQGRRGRAIPGGTAAGLSGRRATSSAS